MPCVCGHEKHAFTEPTVCCDLNAWNCKCEKYVEATPENPVDPLWEDYVAEMKSVKGKVQWLLDNVKFLRNYPNKLFVDWFRQKVYDADPETVRRTKQKLVEDSPGRYGPFEAPELEMQKQLKQIGIEEWLTNQMAIGHPCGSMAYRLSYQRKSIEDSGKYFPTNRYYCPKCDIVIRLTEGE